MVPRVSVGAGYAMKRFGTRWHRFVSTVEYDAASIALDVPSLQGVAEDLDGAHARGKQRLDELLTYSSRTFAEYGVRPADVAARGIEAFGFLAKRDLRRMVEAQAWEGRRIRWNRTSGSTNVPLRSPLGLDHERNQIVKWFRHWKHFGISETSNLQLMTPRSYRLRDPLGDGLRDLAGGHSVTQLHPGGRPVLTGDIVVANPHVLESIFPDGWLDEDVGDNLKLRVNSYEQALASASKWPAQEYGDVWGLSEVGDCAWKVGNGSWLIHDDMIYVELADAERLQSGRYLGELVVTDLTNTVFPIIRYRTNDLGIADVDEDRGAVRELLHVAGRRIAPKGTCLYGTDLVSALLFRITKYGLRFDVWANRTTVWIALYGANQTELTSAKVELSRKLDIDLHVRADRPTDGSMVQVLRAPEVSGVG